MLNILASFLIAIVMSTSASASIIAVIDSGTDMNHELIRPNAWNNPTEIPNNDRDEDENGYQDDVYGWNFAEQNNLVIDRKYIGSFSQDPYLFFEIQGKLFLQEATAAEIKWLREKASDPNFLKEMQIFGNFVQKFGPKYEFGINIKTSSSNILIALCIFKLPVILNPEFL